MAITLSDSLIPGAGDGVLAKTDAIKDETHGKFQNEINAEFKTDIETLDENTFKKTGGTINGPLNVYNAEQVDSTKVSTQIRTDAYGMELVGADGTMTFVAPDQIISPKISIVDGTKEQILLADGTTSEIMKDTDVEQAIAAAWGS